MRNGHLAQVLCQILSVARQRERQPYLGHVGLQGLEREVVEQGFQYPETVLVMHPARHQLLEDAQHTLQNISPHIVRHSHKKEGTICAACDHAFVTHP